VHKTASADADLGRLGLVLSIGRIVGGIAALGWTLYAARRLQGEWGQLSTVLAFAAVASVGTDLGIPLALTQLACRHTTLDRHAVLMAMRRRAAAGSVAAIFLVVAWTTNSSAEGRWGLAALYGISVTINPLTSSFLALLRGRARGVIEACYEAGRQIAIPALGIVLINADFGVYGVLAAYVSIDVVSALIISVLARRQLGFTGTADAGERQELALRQTLPLSANGIVGNAYERVDSALLAPLAGPAAVGIYRMVTPLVGAVLMPAKAMGDAAAVGAGRADPAQLRAVASKFALKAVLFSAPLAVLLAVVGPILLPRVLHPPAHSSLKDAIDWHDAAGPLRILMVTTVPTAVLAVLTPVAITANRRKVFKIALVALCLNALLNLALVPDWGAGLGASGAALAFFTTETVLACVFWTTLAAKSPAKVGDRKLLGAADKLAIEPA